MSIPSPDTIVEDFEFFDDWEDRYGYIIDLGKALEPLPEEMHTQERLIKGCQSNVWVEVERQGDKLHFVVDSDALIVRGLLALVLAAYQDKTPSEIVAFAIDDYFLKLDLQAHLSPTRGNGLRSIVARIQAIAEYSLTA